MVIVWMLRGNIIRQLSHFSSCFGSQSHSLSLNDCCLSSLVDWIRPKHIGCIAYQELAAP